VFSYRLYRIGPNARLLPPEIVVGKDDGEALEAAARLLDGHAGELWRGGRLLGAFSKLGVFTPREG
jgi:hypothetical protein